MEFLDSTVGSTFGLAAPKGRFGIEIELEGEHLPFEIGNGCWQAKADGSLREGIEYVSNPTNTPRDDVDALFKMLLASKAVLQPSYRCSTHIHYNFVNKTWREVVGTIIAWNLLEPLFLMQMPPGRDGSIFCMSAYDTGDLPLNFVRFCEELKKKFQYAGFNTVCRQKYASLNLTRLCDLGTLEFRIFPPSVDGQKIREWCLWLDKLVGLTTNVPFTDFSAFIKHAEKNPVEFVKSVFGRLPVPEDQVGAWVDLGCKTGYELVRVFNNSLKKKTRKKPSYDELEEAQL